MAYNYLTMSDVKKSESRKLFSVISMFAGFGGSSTGYRLAGGNVLAMNEFQDVARSIYHKNYPNTIIMSEDIRDLTGKEILKRVGLKKGELDILDGSPPCAVFSTAGQRDKAWGKVKKYSYTYQRIDDLFFEFARILKDIQPKVFVCENTKGLTAKTCSSLLGSNNKLVSLIGEEKTILGELKKCGYNLYTKVLDSSGFGVAQKRERLFIVGVRKDIKKKFIFPKPYSEKINTEEVIRKFIFNGSEKELKENTETYKTIKEYIKPLYTLTETKKTLTMYGLKGFKQRLARDNWKRPHRTISQSDWVIHAIADRFESINESKLIQSFPIDFNLLGNPYKRIEVTIEDLKNNKYDFANENAGLDKVHLNILKPKKNEIFYIDVKKGKPKKEMYIENDELYTTWVHRNRANEFVGRAVPSLLIKAIVEKIYEDIL